ncbi:MAG: VWA domain-containing protein [Gammaproteobacteria bacterium]|nr:VWA domain-containing protein [Gammaproteobacteria bacterium]
MTNDPWDARLLAAKFFLAGKIAGARVALAAFAADDVASGEASELAQQPVTFFPLGNARFVDAGETLFSAIDSLASLEGGAAPLYAAIDASLDFTATHSAKATTPSGKRRAVVVLTDGLDDTCGNPAQCSAMRDAVIARSRAEEIDIVTIGQPSLAGDARALTALTQDGGTALWAEDHQLAIVFGALGPVLDGSAPSHVMRFRVETTTMGVFQSGRTMLGRLKIEICPFDCFSMSIPVAVPIPRSAVAG